LATGISIVFGSSWAIKLANKTLAKYMSETRKQYFLSILYEDEKSFLENLLFIGKLYKGIFIFARKSENWFLQLKLQLFTPCFFTLSIYNWKYLRNCAIFLEDFMIIELILALFTKKMAFSTFTKSHFSSKIN
jgi:hypothetical protein